MKMRLKISLAMLRGLMFISAIALIHSCALVKTTHQELSDGIYSLQEKGSNARVRVELDSVGFSIKPIAQKSQPVTTAARHVNDLPPDARLIRQSPDLDFLTFPVKYRPASEGVAPQLNSNLNGALYFGYRIDRFRVNSKQRLKEELDHFGISGGLFAGLGNTFISPTTTAGRQALEYDGVVFIRGAAVILAVKRFTVGLAIGRDRLTDGNDRNWIYRNKTWTGIAVGLNIN